MKTTRTKPFRPQVAPLEIRMMLDGSQTLPAPAPEPPADPKLPSLTALRAYYGLDAVQFSGADGATIKGDGSGQTIVVMDTDRDASFRDSESPDWMESGLAQYSQIMGLPYNATSTDSDFNFTMIGMNGDANSADLPAAATTKGAATEFDLDIEGAHMIAPHARIIAVVLPSSSFANFDTAITTVLADYHPAAISISYNSPETPGGGYSAYVDGNGTSYFVSAGDSGAGMQYRTLVTGLDKSGNYNYQTKLTYLPMGNSNPLQILAGGTTVRLGSDGGLIETAWGDGTGSYQEKHGIWASPPSTGVPGGGGGGYSLYEARPLFQSQSPFVAANQASFPAPSAGMRLGPDISMDSDSGIAVLSYDPGNDDYYWQHIGGTSLASPMLAAMMTVVAQGRAAAGLPALSSSDTLNFLYQLPEADFHDITAGSTGYAAGPGFDLATGRGTPTAKLIDDLAAATYPTTVALSAAPVPDQPEVTMTAQVAPTFGARVASGSVIFSDDGKVLATVPLDGSGRATFVEQGAMVGNHSMQAQFVGSGFFAASTGAAQAAVVAPLTTTKFTVVTTGIVAANQPVTLAATVAAPFNSNTPVGIVGFYDGSTLLGLAPIDAEGRATLTTVGLTSPGIQSLRAIYGGSASFASSTSDAAAVTVTSLTATALAVQPGGTVSGGQPLTFTATVTAQAGSTIPTGSVSFYDGTTLLGTDDLDETGQATYTGSPTALGLHALRAVFNGSQFALTSTSTSDPLVVTPIATTTAVAAATGNLVGQTRALTLSATVAVGPGSPTPTGEVDFAEDGQIVGSSQLDDQGHASITLTSSAAGAHQVTATYAGAGLFGGSTSGTGSVAIDPAATTTSLVAAGTAVLIKQPVSLTATVVGPGGSPPAGGTVTFWDNGQVVATAALDANGVAAATYTPTTVGAHSLLATFGGSGLLEASSSPLGSLTVLAQPTTTLLRVLTPSVLAANIPVVLAASVVMADGTVPAGATISFWDNGQVVGSAQVDDDGQASFAYTPGGGVHYLTAGFAGSALAAASLSPLDAVAVMPAATITTLVARPFGAATTLMATVTSAGATPAGVVEFRDGARVLARQALDASGRATVAVRINPKWGHQVAAVFEGSGDFTTSEAIGSTSQGGSASRRVAIRAAIATPAGPRAGHKAAARSVARHH